MNKIFPGFDKLKQKEQKLEQKLKNLKLAYEPKMPEVVEYFNKFKGCYQLSTDARKTCQDSHTQMLKKFEPIFQLNAEISLLEKDLKGTCADMTAKTSIVKWFKDGIVPKLIMACNNKLKYSPSSSRVSVDLISDQFEYFVTDDGLDLSDALNMEIDTSDDDFPDQNIIVDCKNLDNILNIIEEAQKDFNE